ncbi:rRNA N6-adenosine-methyltransferase METTL5-like protein [Drosera capensis]
MGLFDDMIVPLIGPATYQPDQARYHAEGKTSQPRPIQLEQYPTGPHIAARMLYTAENSFGNVEGKVVADFGCGCGTLGLAAALLDAEYVMGFDIDDESLVIASSNADDLEHVKRMALRDFGAISAEVLCQVSHLKLPVVVICNAVVRLYQTLRFDVPQLYKFHKKKEVDIAVDLWRFTPCNSRERRRI